MKKQTAARAAAFLWLSFTGLVSPAWTGLIYMDVTGHGKGYGYDLGSEADISVFFGVLLLAVWLGAVLPVMLRQCKNCRAKAKRLTPLPPAVFLLFYLLGIALMGWGEFLELFGLEYPPLS